MKNVALRLWGKNEKQDGVHLVECRKKEKPVVLKMCLFARASLILMHYSETTLGYVWYIGLYISGSRFHHERGRASSFDSATATFVCTFAYRTVSTFWFSAALNLSRVPDKATSKSAQVSPTSFVYLPPGINHAFKCWLGFGSRLKDHRSHTLAILLDPEVITPVTRKLREYFSSVRFQ